ncbi:Endosialin [Tupaia chinensis]|uniref:Endosialin n=1 Tax=Tupaia chinensis TaxID=246437 RepID=L8Y3D5_TUPCH|nr:Endosialin [Tupaia chinensis]
MLLRLLLAWAATVPTLGQAPWATKPRAACGPGSCYALFPQRRTFLEAWLACRELGGNLATPRTPEEAQRVDSLVGAGPASKLLWIGLQRQGPPQRPLRGFTWTTGDQDTAFTNWAQPATGGPCPAQRCAALEASGEHRWLEGSCTLAVDGYLCQFGFEGACPALPEEAGQAGPAVYTTPFQLVSTEFEWVAGRSRRDDRWLLVALLVPTCVFLVVLLALGIVYCTRCGPHAPNKRITDCYRWVTQAGSKGPTEPMPPRGSLTGVQTCRTSV